jgi:hypothetical protein
MKRTVRILSLLSVFSIGTGIVLAQQAGTAGVLEGKVTDLITQKGILAATVTATDTHKKIYKTITTQDGSYRLENLPLNGSVTLACSQLGYSPNPQTALVELKSGKGQWNPTLIESSGDADYIAKVVDVLTSGKELDASATAQFVAANVDPDTKKTIAVKLKRAATAIDPTGSPREHVDASKLALLFDASAKSDLPEERRAK